MRAARALAPVLTLLAAAVLLLPPSASGEDLPGGWSTPTPAASTPTPPPSTPTPKVAPQTPLPPPLVRPVGASASNATSTTGTAGTGAGPRLDVAAPVVPALRANITLLSKQHNVVGTAGTTSLRLSVGFEVQATAASEVYIAASFHDAGTGEAILARAPVCADAAGRIAVRTQPTQVFRATLEVPYAAFPAPSQGTTGSVLAVVRVLGSSHQPLAQARTTFFVHAQ